VARILIADTLDGAVTLERILQGHDYHVVNTMRAAEKLLKDEVFDLIVAGLHFDESQMFELIREVRKSQKNATRPIICFCSRETSMSRLMYESLESSTKVLGAWMYLNESSYRDHQNPDAEIRRIIERCLTKESRKEIQLQRLDIHRQRLENQQLRTLLHEQEWSPELKDYLAFMKDELELLLKEVTRLHSVADVQRASVETSRDLKDRVAQHVVTTENDIASTEETQTASETMLSAEEEELARKEIKADGPHKDTNLP